MNQVHEVDKMFCLTSEKSPCNFLGITARQWVRQLMQFPRIVGQLAQCWQLSLKNANKESSFARQMYLVSACP